jgi:hypothetical protein
VVRIGPYNSVAYEVTLTASYEGLWIPLKVGHVFDCEHRVIDKLHAVSVLILPLGAVQLAAKAGRYLSPVPPDL